MVKQLATALGLGLAASGAAAFESFDPSALDRWSYVADGVMGGVSQGRAGLSDGAMRMVGRVSTANNGGFIQVRRGLMEPWSDTAQGLRLEVRGNGELYYVFLRTPGLWRPGWSFRAAFPTGEDWTTVTLPFADFAASSPAMPQAFAPGEVISIGIVAYGRDHDAGLSVRDITLY